MATALKSPPRPMTVAEFMDWDSGDGSDETWQLRDGVPEMMAPASDTHAFIQAKLVQLLLNHLDKQGGGCTAAVAPGVLPALRPDINMLVPDIGVTCEQPAGRRSMRNPLLLVEILSPSNAAKTRANVQAFTTLPSVAEILLIHSTRIAAELLRRRPDRGWPAQPLLLGPDDYLTLTSIGFVAKLRDAYITSGL